MGAEISPVYAPSFTQNTSWAPISMLVDFADSTAIAMLTKGGQTTTSACSAPATSGANCVKNTLVSGTVLYIFQLPAITGLRMCFSSEPDAGKLCAQLFQSQRGRYRVVRPLTEISI